KHCRINPSKLFLDKQNHIKGIGMKPRHMHKLKGISRESLSYFLKECEWRFNTPTIKAKLDNLIQWIFSFLTYCQSRIK
ncbi:MAG: IS1595 family transposase, partial [Alphaproteobacteria bacterium]|nr:IS1595 family transposase [Alphaproteobacteria bacterium]